jgi:hypothetical protein
MAMSREFTGKVLETNQESVSVSPTGRILLVNPKVPKMVFRIYRYGGPMNMEQPKPHQRPYRVEGG